MTNVTQLIEKPRSDGTVSSLFNLNASAPLDIALAPREDTQALLQLASGDMILGAEVELFNHVAPNDYMWTEEGARSVKRSIIFRKPFTQPPMLTYGLCAYDASQANNQRFRLQLIRVGVEGFKIALHTWGDSKIARAWIVGLIGTETRHKG